MPVDYYVKTKYDHGSRQDGLMSSVRDELLTMEQNQLLLQGRDELARLIKANGSQKEFAELTKIPSGHLSRVKNGWEKPNPAFVKNMKDYLESIYPENMPKLALYEYCKIKHNEYSLQSSQDRFNNLRPIQYRVRLN